MSSLNDDQLRRFAERGSVVIPNVVPTPLVEAAMQQIDRLVEQNPPPADRRGFHFYWEQNLADTDPLVALLQESRAREIVESLIAPLAFFMGMPFPLGLSRVWSGAPALVPWAWGVNGCASVLSAILAALIAMTLGFSSVVLAASLLYAGAAMILRRPLEVAG